MTELPEESVAPPREEQAHEQQGDAEEDAEGDARVPLTPGLVVLGLVAVALGLFAAVVMSAHSLAR